MHNTQWAILAKIKRGFNLSNYVLYLKMKQQATYMILALTVFIRLKISKR